MVLEDSTTISRAAPTSKDNKKTIKSPQIKPNKPAEKIYDNNCSNSLKEMADSKTNLQNTISQLSNLVKETNWINNTNKLQEVGSWKDINDLYKWTDFIGKYIYKIDPANCNNYTTSISNYLNQINLNNIYLTESIYRVKEKEFKIKQETNCIGVACNNLYNKTLNNELSMESQDNKDLTKELKQSAIRSINNLVEKLQNLN